MIAMATVGTALAYWVDFGMVFTTGQAVWRFPVAFQIIWCVYPYPSPLKRARMKNRQKYTSKGS
jgi:hypothetical protein